MKVANLVAHSEELLGGLREEQHQISREELSGQVHHARHGRRQRWMVKREKLSVRCVLECRRLPIPQAIRSVEW